MATIIPEGKGLETKVDRFGRVVIPKAMRDQLSLEPGTLLEVDAVGGEVRLRRVEEASGLFEKGGILVHGGKPVGPLEGVQEQLREERIRSSFPSAW